MTTNLREEFDALTGTDEMSVEGALEHLRTQVREEACVFDAPAMLEQLDMIALVEEGTIVPAELELEVCEPSLDELVEAALDREDPEVDRELVESLLGEDDGFEGGAVFYAQDMADAGWELSDLDHLRGLEALSDSPELEALDVDYWDRMDVLDAQERARRAKAWKSFSTDPEPRLRRLTVISTTVAREEETYVDITVSDGEHAVATSEHSVYIHQDVRGVAVVKATAWDISDDQIVYISGWDAVLRGIARTGIFFAVHMEQIISRAKPSASSDPAIGKIVVAKVVKHLRSGVLVRNEHGQKGLIGVETIKGVGSAANAMSFLRSKCPVGREVTVEIVARRDQGDFVLKLS